VRGAQEVWLSRIEQRGASMPVWPSLSMEELAEVGPRIDQAWSQQFAELTDADLDRVVSYTNSAGVSYDTRLEDILLHLMLHGQYHRGKANAALRAAGMPPVGVDYIVWQRLKDRKIERLRD
jgi:uncharacterized damage-inducible protein DinB